MRVIYWVLEVFIGVWRGRLTEHEGKFWTRLGFRIKVPGSELRFRVRVTVLGIRLRFRYVLVLRIYG